MVIDAGSTVVRAEGLPSTEVDDDLVVLNLRTDSYIAIDRIGRRIWELLESPRRVEDLIATLAAEFDVDPTIVAHDVAPFLDELEREGMVTMATPPAGRVA